MARDWGQMWRSPTEIPNLENDKGGSAIPLRKMKFSI